MKRVILSLCWVWMVSLLNAQNTDRTVIAAGGNSITTTALQVNWTIGESMTTARTIEALHVTQGYQQSEVVAELTTTTPEAVELQLDVYPNPATELLNVRWNDPQATLRFRLIDMKGQTVKSGASDGNSLMSIPVTDIAAGTYSLVATASTGMKVQSWKVVVMHP